MAARGNCLDRAGVRAGSAAWRAARTNTGAGCGGTSALPSGMPRETD